MNKVLLGDNLSILRKMDTESVDLIYLDPPFNSGRAYSAPAGSKAAGASFKDTWTWQDVDEDCLEHLISDYPYLVQYIRSIGIIHSDSMMSYVTYMTQRLIELHRVLKSTGSLYLHCDPTASHYLKIVLDRIFDEDNYRNEIVWCYATGGASKTRFAKKHDLILMYSKEETFTFNTPRIPYTSAMSRDSKHAHKFHKKGKICPDWWSDIPAINPQANERTGYPTQKPVVLLRRIIKASSNEDDVVLDPFCGSGTTLVAAKELGRNFIGIDINEEAIKVSNSRLPRTLFD